MKSDALSTKLYGFNKTVKAAIGAQMIQGHESIMCSALLYRKGKRLNSIEKADSSSFSKLILNYVRNEDPDKLKVELHGNEDELLWTKTFTLETESDREYQAKQAKTDVRGLGEAEVSELVSQKIQEIRRTDELEDLRSYRDQLETENNALHKQVDELQDVVDAKKNIEYYLNIVGLALPGLAKMLSKTSLGSSLGMLAGIEDPQQPSEQIQDKDQRQTIIDLVLEFMQSLDMTSLGHLYMVFVELSNNPALIPNLLSNLTQKNANHDIQNPNQYSG